MLSSLPLLKCVNWESLWLYKFGMYVRFTTTPFPPHFLVLSLYSLFHFILLFWNQILIWFSVRFRLVAISIRLVRVRYLLKWNSFSNSTSWFWAKVNRFFWFAGLISFFSSSTLFDFIFAAAKQKDYRSSVWFSAVIRRLGALVGITWTYACAVGFRVVLIIFSKTLKLCLWLYTEKYLTIVVKYP